MKPGSFNTTLARPKLVVHDYSRTICKQKPKIRIIHIVEPKIIQTDAENFQELVQRLTGKPVERKGNKSDGKISSSRILHPKPYCSKTGMKMGSVVGAVPVFQETQRVKKEMEEIHDDADNEDGVLSFLDELDGFFLHDFSGFLSPSENWNEASFL